MIFVPDVQIGSSRAASNKILLGHSLRQLTLSDKVLLSTHSSTGTKQQRERWPKTVGSHFIKGTVTEKFVIAMVTSIIECNVCKKYPKPSETRIRSS